MCEQWETPWQPNWSWNIKYTKLLSFLSRFVQGAGVQHVLYSSHYNYIHSLWF